MSFNIKLKLKLVIGLCNFTFFITIRKVFIIVPANCYISVAIPN